MKLQEYEPDNEPKKSGKGFYWALAVCLLAVCGVAVSTVINTLPKDEPQGMKNTTASSATTTTQVRQVVIPATDIPDDRSTTTTKKTTNAATTTADTANLFVLPVSNRVLRKFSETHEYFETLGEWRTHNGVDFEAKQGEAVKAAADGTVKSITEDVLWGDVIVIDHGAKRITKYCGVKAKEIKEGQTVKAGQSIGVVSSVPAEAEASSHIHLELLVNDKYLDPLTLIRGQTVTVPKTKAATTATTTATTKTTTTASTAVTTKK